MQKSIISIIILLLLLPAISAAPAFGNSPQIKVTLQSQNPDPVEPGQVVTVKFKVENEGAETKNFVTIRLLPKEPFSLYGDPAEKNIGILRASSTGADAVVVEFKLKINEEAVESETKLELDLLTGEGGGLHYEFPIDIATHDAVLDITAITVEPSQIAPGETGKVTVMVKNLADSLLKDIKLKLDFTNSDLPFAPYQSSSERRLAQLRSGFQNALEFTIITDPGAAPGLYKIPLNITYSDEKGKNYYVNDILAMTIGDTPKVKPFVKKSTLLRAREAGTITLTIANTGPTDVKFVELQLLPSDDIQLLSPTDYIYIGDIDSDDTESEEIPLYVNSRVKEIEIPLRLKYFDANNKPFQQQFNLPLQLYSGTELKRFGLVEANNTGIFLFLILLIVAGYFYYRRSKKKQ